MNRRDFLTLALASPLAMPPWQSAFAIEKPHASLYLCESHHHVLPFWIRAGRKGLIPGQGARVVHIDSHPDMAPPRRTLPGETPSNSTDLLDYTDISTYQLCAGWLGVASHIEWIAPEWSGQLPPGERKLSIGKAPDGMAVDTPLNYYVLDGAWSEKPAEARTLDFKATPWASFPGTTPHCDILDIDLDTFATLNPSTYAFTSTGFSREEIDTLRHLVRLDLIHWGPPAGRTRQKQDLLTDFRTAVHGGSEEREPARQRILASGLPEQNTDGILNILSVDSSLRPAVFINSIGDLVFHPEITPPQKQREEMMDAVAEYAAKARPRVVTIARSVSDGFTPKELAGEIEQGLLRRLRSALMLS